MLCFRVLWRRDIRRGKKNKPNKSRLREGCRKNLKSKGCELEDSKFQRKSIDIRHSLQ